MKAIFGMIDNFWSFLAGCVMAVMGYLLPVKDIVHLLILFFTLDVIFGYWAAKKLRNEKFSVKKIWEHTVPRMLFSMIIVIAAFMWDTTFNQKFVSTYYLIGWWFSGVLLLSIVQNAYKITRWDILPKIGKKLKNKIENEI